jgi:hypothetical protein
MINKRIAINQPYFFPYIGYFQLINSVDEFIIYDNIQYTKKGWINRNRILVNGKDQLITLPIKKDSDYLDIVDRKLADSWDDDKIKIMNIIKLSYVKAPYFHEVYKLIQRCLNNDRKNLFEFIFDILKFINEYLDIKTKIIISSTINIDHSLKSQDKVLAICKAREATTYVNAIGGQELYSKNIFKQNGLNLNFIKTDEIYYNQFKNEFIPFLSIIDIMMFNSSKQIKEYLNKYTLI